MIGLIMARAGRCAPKAGGSLANHVTLDLNEVSELQDGLSEGPRIFRGVQRRPTREVDEGLAVQGQWGESICGVALKPLASQRQTNSLTTDGRLRAIEKQLRSLGEGHAWPTRGCKSGGQPRRQQFGRGVSRTGRNVKWCEGLKELVGRVLAASVKELQKTKGQPASGANGPDKPTILPQPNGCGEGAIVGHTQSCLGMAVKPTSTQPSSQEKHTTAGSRAGSIDKDARHGLAKRRSSKRVDM
jgi:hypothetical protein